MSIKKEMLQELTEQQLLQLAEDKGIKFKLNKTQKEYYANWDEKDKIIDLMTDNPELSVTDIEQFIMSKKD